MKVYLLCALSAFALCFIVCLILIPLLKKLKAGQNILSYVSEHKNKEGTPTMAGLAFVVSSCAVFLIAGGGDRLMTVLASVFLAFAAVGFIDDVLKLKGGKNEGLTPWQKLFFQIGVAAIIGAYCCVNGYTLVYIPFTGFALDIGWFMLPLAAFTVVATTNCVNLTDGLDGLAASSSASYFFCFSLLLAAQGEFDGVACAGFSVAGALAAFLIFNTNRASAFMGDTGSLALGAMVAAVGIFTGNIAYIAVIGAVFVFSGISVIIQVIYYKRTGRRVFLMAPAHHHFQKKGYSESKIAAAYSSVTLFIGLLCAALAC